MTATPRLELPLLAAAQAQKHVTHNEALRRLDALVHLSVLDMRAAPPASPAEGDRHLVLAPGTGAFAGRDGALAVREDGGWSFLAPGAGWAAWVQALGRTLVFDGADWVDPPARTADMFGVGATPDAVNRLAVASPAALFTHEGADMRVVVNKAAPGATASLVLQDDWAARAEIGLAGDDDLRFKVADDGGVWRDGLIADRSTGRVRFPTGLEDAITRAPLRSLMFTSGGDGTVSLFRLDATRSAHPRTALVAAIAGDEIVLTAPVANQFFGAIMQDVSRARIWNLGRTPAAPVWIVAAPAPDRLRALDAASLAGFAAGDTLQMGDPYPSASPTRAIALDVSPMLQRVFGSVFPQSGLLMKTAVAGVAARAGLGVSGSAVSGSFVFVNSAPDGGMTNGMAIIPCATPSPVSNSNLVFVREDEGAPGAMSICIASCLGVYV